jgi:hypothetical protein
MPTPSTSRPAWTCPACSTPAPVLTSAPPPNRRAGAAPAVGAERAAGPTPYGDVPSMALSAISALPACCCRSARWSGCRTGMEVLHPPGLPRSRSALRPGKSCALRGPRRPWRQEPAGVPRMSPAGLADANGLGFSFRSLIHLRMLSSGSVMMCRMNGVQLISAGRGEQDIRQFCVDGARSGNIWLAARPVLARAAVNRAAGSSCRMSCSWAAAALAPAALSLVTATFAEGRERNRAMGIWGAVAG